jgi:aspartyl-tRNA(Asn)/glutamyl-tRNA(Gln) amidotransferase subunit A
MATQFDRASLEHVAQLASLTLTEREAEALAGDMQRILAYVGELETVDTSGVDPSASGSTPIGRVGASIATSPKDASALRDDEPEPSLDRAEVLAQAPRATEQGFLVPPFVESRAMLEALIVTDVPDRVRSGEIAAAAIAEDVVRRIDAIDPALHAFLHVNREGIVNDARAIDARRSNGEALGPLAGVPIALKDALCTRGMPTTCASRILEGYVPPYDATVVARLRAAGALLTGKTNMDEFAMGSSNENSAYGVVHNPWDLSRAPGGSSGGSAAAVAARLSLGALGSDTGGSIRQPASLTGTFGLKPTYGRVSRFGLVAFASSLDQIGPFATDVRGAARVLSVIAGKDPKDATSLDAPVDDFEAACGRSLRGLRLGVPAEYFARGLDGEVEASVRAAIGALEAEGCSVVPVTLPHTRFAVATYYVIATAEASSNLARFDGVRYGLRVEPPHADVKTLIGATRDKGFGLEVKRRILLGTFVLSAGYYEAYYLKAQKTRTLLRRDFERAFTGAAGVDAIVCPTAPSAAFALGEKTGDPLSMYLSDVYTLPASLAGIPAASVPCAPTKSGLPIGLQILAPALKETPIVALASAWEARSPARGAIPPIARLPGLAAPPTREAAS